MHRGAHRSAVLGGHHTARRFMAPSSHIARTVDAVLEHKGTAAIPPESFMVSQSDSAQDAAARMLAGGFHNMLVRDPARNVVVGRVSDRQFCQHIMKGQLQLDTPVEQIMESGTAALHLSCRVERAIHLMFRHHTRHLPVFDRDVVPSNLDPAFAAGDIVRGLPLDGFRGLVEIPDVVFAYADKIAATPGRELCEVTTVQSMMDLKLRGCDPMDVYAMPEDTVPAVAFKMQGQYNIGCQLITSAASGEYLGLVTESDMVAKAVAIGRLPDESLDATEIMDVMGEIPERVDPEMNLQEALDVMRTHIDAPRDSGWKYFPVIDSSGEFYGCLLYTSPSPRDS
eukprot:TRINITY_DN11214_c0_g1_i2.p1 TRINITY_DN11214_c0_g1~~TRINITY_DN11214_c0_g1_i2.p1  ORF type:complete len:340 (+),score=75.26 TRINITY_DN11214_c0_g1_i2:84-1103(+)